MATRYRSTQTLLAHMLGVQRPSITNAIRELERARLIALSRRQVTILDQSGADGGILRVLSVGPNAGAALHVPKTYLPKGDLP